MSSTEKPQKAGLRTPSPSKAPIVLSTVVIGLGLQISWDQERSTMICLLTCHR